LCSLFGRYNISTARSRISHLRGGTAAALVHCNVVVTVLKILGSYCTSLDKVLRHSIGSHLAPNSYYNGHLLSGSLCRLESCSFGTIGARDRTQVTPKLTTVSYGGLKEGNGDVTMTGISALDADARLQNEYIAAGVAYLFNNFILTDNMLFPTKLLLHLISIIMRVFQTPHTLQIHYRGCISLVTMTQL